ncbi:hypothetical protein MGYG_01794 [Nannizzia gypsea CBS 118893]|uniref:Uncharacterized protein n=1 Tax=Arthroderma gypseum (strain ATCC MYA-4604 / CBS 118893) TaxID=535722 RepID=E5R3I0_ARTGP|nr:hypothetical protein MGYG_01794 [Nannizzia gypsea CBS 118893]EFQ98779.1 hypothetical protein MGYG_01794 [Nannizzia gypsea CBS 118893]
MVIDDIWKNIVTQNLDLGIVITVTVIVAAGIAAYESPEIQRWLDTSRRKIALALHSLGDGISPDKQRTANKDDISMVEATGTEAEARRQKAREDIMRRHALLTAKRRTASEGSMNSFDKLVDSEGRLKDTTVFDKEPENTVSKSSGIELPDLSRVVPVNVQQGDTNATSHSVSMVIPDIDPDQRRALIEKLQLNTSFASTLDSETSSHHPSESLVNLTPTSEFPDADFQASIHISEPGIPAQGGSPSASHTEDGEPDFYYAHPDHHNQAISQAGGVIFDADGSHTPVTQPSPAPSIASSLSHINNDPFESVSDDSISDIVRSRDGVYTPVSWSEVGSVTSSNDGGHA